MLCLTEAAEALDACAWAQEHFQELHNTNSPWGKNFLHGGKPFCDKYMVWKWSTGLASLAFCGWLCKGPGEKD